MFLIWCPGKGGGGAEARDVLIDKIDKIPASVYFTF